MYFTRFASVAAIFLVSACADISNGTTTVKFGDDTSEWANDGECDDPRFKGPASATKLLPVDTGRDATDCRDLLTKGYIKYVG